ncbi:NUDIX hydrolase [Maritimibacter sp. 55A14]|uniref:NUDIX hydrolase n=1 Tax=Maritimibacter sp. 55A14 TaxID=2174844 RepID=UPI000D618C07|nr:NUDIX hydrolase [Maritimibacter sp. 55A14]PWE32167.1 NUDIX hydrolase [Maritimibacter sp. 55A14]
MGTLFERAWSEVVKPLLRRPPRVQVAALCYRRTDDGKQVLMITSRDTGRWILPKGWPMEGYDAPGTAMQEAWEEAGVKTGRIDRRPLGRFTYVKQGEDGMNQVCEVDVFPMEVQDMTSDFPEQTERRLKWVAPKEAANMVDEPELRDILAAF